MSNVPTNVKWKRERERERKRGSNKWKTNLCFALSRKNLHLTTTTFTCLSCLLNKQLLLYTRNHFTSVLTQHTPDELDTSILLILSCVTSSQRRLKGTFVKANDFMQVQVQSQRK